ncbi:Membrane fusogenic activity [Candidatus Arsenophonus lipoptenae]|uniref:Membrane fusogenic activity n=1 Tax=Candidatus Arsenophonus lipoptenae TaxID=634113 RepID=A0A0X9VEI6_9GAMM|nr:accessory factor UbiK family protein [Candidatus Arsenophonus lipoptenae]AMA65019.1 Membrane fusogenic activity [Candidatus Arsenophonus lipoptenae]
MDDNKNIKQIFCNIKNIVSKIIFTISDNFNQKLFEILQYQLEKLDLISRKEFDIQMKILFKNHKKIIQMETRIEELKKILLSNNKK